MPSAFVTSFAGLSPRMGPVVVIATALLAGGAWSQPVAAPRPAQEGGAAAAPAYVPLTAAEEKAFLAELAATLGPIRTLRAEFEQERHIALFEQPLRASGRFAFAKPDRLRWEVRSPYVSLLLLNARGVAKFDEVDGALRRMNPGSEDLLREVLRQIAAWIRGDFSAARELYDLTLERGPDHRLRMAPKSKEMAKRILAVEIHFDPETHRVRRVIIREPGDDHLEIRFFREEQDLDLDPRLFDLEQPLFDAGSSGAPPRAKAAADGG